MQRRSLAALFAVAVLGGCAANFQQIDPATVDWGPRPTAAHVEAAVRRHFDNVLKDGESARFQISTPYKAYANGGLAYGGGVTWTGYAVKVQVNAKNSYGAYTGFKPYQVLFTRDGFIYHVQPGEEHVLIHRAE